ncbi:MAG: PEP-utilizing enzyme [Patescibacteria group bacterium]
MKITDYKKENFLPSGSAELPLIYLRSSAAGAAMAIGGPLFFCFIDGVGHSFAFKKGVTRLKNELINSKYEDLEKEFKSWKKKWDSFDDELYAMATDKSENYKNNWHRLDEVSIQLWVESYKVETLDNFSEEIEKLLTNKLAEKGIDASLLHEIISPNSYTRIQEASQDIEEVLSKRMSYVQYLRKHWFAHGSWAGGELMTEELLKNDFEHIAEETDFIKRGEIQARAERLLDKKTANLIKIIRLLSLWREERKANIQKYCLGYKVVADALSKKLTLDRKTAEWLLYEDLNDKLNQKEIINRKNKSVFMFSQESSKGMFMPEIEAKKIIKEFFKIKKAEEIKGMVASRGLVNGKVCIVLKNEDFHKFLKGDILVTNMTRPEFLPLVKKAIAIITDDGGITCHAAIISRELKIPCVVGTKIATKVLKDGQLVEVDANKGVVKILNK